MTASGPAAAARGPAFLPVARLDTVEWAAP